MKSKSVSLPILRWIYPWLRPALIGSMAGGLAILPYYLHQGNVGFQAFFFLGFALIFRAWMVFQSPDRDSPSELVVGIHTPPPSPPVLTWSLRALFSLALSSFSGFFGVEGAATESGQAAGGLFRGISRQWSEPERRTDAVCALSAGIAAALGSPFAAILVGLEMSLGGRTVPVVVSALAGAAVPMALRVPPLWTGSFTWDAAFATKEMLLSFLVLIVCSVLFSGLVFIAIKKLRGLSSLLFKGKVWQSALLAGILAATLCYFDPRLMQNAPDAFLYFINREGFSPLELPHLLLGQFLLFTALFAWTGFFGIFTPTFLMGACLGGIVAGWFSVPALPLILLGVSNSWGAILGLPLASAALFWDLSKSWQLGALALLTSLITQELRKLIWKYPLIDQSLEARGFPLLEGRSRSVLESISVRDTLASDCPIVDEGTKLEELHKTLLNSPYPFLVVNRSDGKFLGLLSGLEIEKLHSRSQGRTTIEALDLLIRSPVSSGRVKPSDHLSVVQGMFQLHPVVTVIDEEEKFHGLLFPHHVRIAYDREMGRLSLLRSRGKE